MTPITQAFNLADALRAAPFATGCPRVSFAVTDEDGDEAANASDYPGSSTAALVLTYQPPEDAGDDWIEESAAAIGAVETAHAATMTSSGPTDPGYFLRYDLGDANAAYLARTLGMGARLAWALGQPQDGE